MFRLCSWLIMSGVIIFSFLDTVAIADPPGRVGYSWKFLLEACRPVLQILTLYPFSDLACKIHTRCQT